MQQILERANPILPVIVIEKLEHAVPLAQALYRAGLEVLEVTLRSDCALPAISAIKVALPQLSVGAGTYTDPAQSGAIAAAGADFVVSPGISHELIDAARQQGLPILPGIMTPSDILVAVAEGLNMVKLFPAESAGGVAYIKSLAGPFPGLRFCPTGGINSTNYRDYLTLPQVICVGGSWVAPADWVREERWPEIERITRQATGK